jgi:hypothetical protein
MIEMLIMEPLRVGIDVPEPKLIHRMENFKSFRVQDIISDSSGSYKVGKIEVRNAQKGIPTSTVVCRLFIGGYT